LLGGVEPVFVGGAFGAAARFPQAVGAEGDVVVVLAVVFLGLAGVLLAGLVVLFAVGFGGGEVDVSGVVVHFGGPLVVLVAGSIVFPI
jgi:hypothetical protein